MTRADKVIAFIHKHCKVPEGKLVGKNIKLEKFQQDFIRDVYDNNVPIRTAILSIARKNGKSALMACLILVHLVGPEAKQNAQIVSGAMSRDQAALVFDLACKMIRLSDILEGIIRIIPSKKQLIGLYMNVTYQALAADGKTAQGLSPVFALIDEVGQVVGPRSTFIEAIETSQGAHENPLIVYISTQAANDSDYLSLLIDSAKTSNEKSIVCHVHEAKKDCDIMDEDEWKKANPALDIFRSIEDVREQANKAERMPSSEASFRNLILNQRVSTNAPFISQQTWRACEGDNIPISECTSLWGGLDLSAKTDLTSFVLLGEKDNKFYVYCYAWTPKKGLSERAKRDRAPYDLWVKQGFLRTTSGASIEYSEIADDVAEITKGLNVQCIGYDRWRIDILKKEFENIGYDSPLMAYGQGFKDMSPALDALEGLILNKKLVHPSNPVLNMCAMNACVSKDPAGNRKLDKIKTSGRIDCFQALAIACGTREKNIDNDGDFEGFINSPLVI